MKKIITELKRLYCTKWKCIVFEVFCSQYYTVFLNFMFCLLIGLLAGPAVSSLREVSFQVKNRPWALSKAGALVAASFAFATSLLNFGFRQVGGMTSSPKFLQTDVTIL